MIDLHIDLSGLKAMGKKFSEAAKDAPDAARRAINHTGDKARTAMRVALVIQTGLKRKVINKAVISTRASNKGGGSYTIKSRGGNVSLKYFAARETRAGVTAEPWGKRRLYAGTFVKGGKFPNRVPLRLSGQVFVRAGKGRFPIVKQKSGLFIPEEMVKGQTAEAFYNVVQRDLPERLAHEIMRSM